MRVFGDLTSCSHNSGNNISAAADPEPRSAVALYKLFLMRVFGDLTSCSHNSGYHISAADPESHSADTFYKFISHMRVW